MHDVNSNPDSYAQTHKIKKSEELHVDALPLTGDVGGVKIFSDIAWHLICHCQVFFVICFLHNIMSYGYC